MNVDKYTPFKDFGFYLIVVLSLLLTSYITLFPYLLQYEESNHPSKRAILSNSIFEIVFFSYNFLEKITICFYHLFVFNSDITINFSKSDKICIP